MIHPKYWWPHFQVRRALVNYPLYDVPHKHAEETLPEAEVQENFKYFMSVKLDRLAFFQHWLGTYFGVNATLDGNGILALESWINRFGGGMVDDDPARGSIFYKYSPRWVEAHAGYNAMVDIAIFLGEYLIFKRPNLFWTINRAQLLENRSISGINIGRPVLRGFLRTNEWSDNVFQNAFGFVLDSRERSKIGLHRSQYYMNSLSYKVRSTLHLAIVPASDEPYIFGDYRDEPL